MTSNLPSHYRIWLYQSNRILTEAEENYILEKGKVFIEEWSSHGQKVDARIEVLDHLTVMIGADGDQLQLSGCGIDKSVHFVKEMGTTLGVDFFDRLRVAYTDSSGVMHISTLSDLQLKAERGECREDWYYLDNTIQRAGDLKSYRKPFSEGWLAGQLETV